MGIKFIVLLFCLFLNNEGKKKKKRNPVQGLILGEKNNLKASDPKKQNAIKAIPSLLPSKIRKSKKGENNIGDTNKDKKHKKKNKNNRQKSVKISSQRTSSSSLSDSNQSPKDASRTPPLLVIKHLQRNIRDERDKVSNEPKETSLNNQLKERKSSVSSSGSSSYSSRKSSKSRKSIKEKNKNKKDKEVVDSLIQAETRDAGGSLPDKPNKYAKQIFLISIAAVIVMLLLVLLDQYLQWRKRKNNNLRTNGINERTNQHIINSDPQGLIITPGSQEFKTKFAKDFNRADEGILKWRELIKKIEDEVKQ